MNGAVVGLLAVAMAVPPLTDQDRAQLETAQDGSARIDEAALYPLLGNAMAWEVADESGARIANYHALRQHPSDFRGQLFLIEGKVARSRRFALNRPGPWGEAVTEWVVQFGPNPADVAVVFFVDPQGTMPAPPIRTKVRAAARFYKVWADRDQHDQPTRFLVFVAGRATTTSGRPGGPDPTGCGPGPARSELIVVVGLLLAVFFLLRRTLRPSLPQRRSPVQHRTGHDQLPEPDSPLPEDPADALAELRRRREQSDGSEH